MIIGAAAIAARGRVAETPAAPSVFSVNSADLNGSSQYFSSGDVFDTSADWGCVFWVKFDDLTGNSTIMTDWDTDASIILRYRNTSNAVRLTINNDGANLDATDFGALSTGVWYLIGASYNTVSGYKIAVNTTTQDFVTTAANNLSRGFTYGALSSSNSTQNIDGQMSFGMIYDRSLTDSDFIEIYNSGYPMCHTDLSTSLKTNLVSFWNLSNWDTGTVDNTGDELIDQAGTLDLTNVGSTPFTGTGLSVECT